MGPLESWLEPLPFEGEALRFDLAPHRSRVTGQLLQVRVRLTARAFGVGTELVAANVVDDGAALEVDAAALSAANAAVRSGLEAGPAEAVHQLRRLAGARAEVDRLAAAFDPVGAAVRRRQGPESGPSDRSPGGPGDDVVGYVEAAAVLAALGSLKFCLPDTLRPRLADLLPADLVDPLLAPDGPTLWSVVRGRELALARRRVRGPAGLYRRRLDAHKRAHGYLLGEDVDFRTFESIDAIDARIAASAAGDVDGERRRLAAALADDRATKDRARAAFADRLASSDGDGVATLVSHVLLARALAEQEDLNRRAKVRLLRDLRDLAEIRGLDIERTGLEELAAEPVPAGAA
ncbi:MAG: hypothetical protein ACR2MO_08850 [Acidimicrobiales bacterium]